MKTVYLQSIGGASGDMLLGALLDAGLSLESLEEDLGHLGLPPFKLATHRVQRRHVTATFLEVVCPPDEPTLSPQQLLDIVDSSDLDQDVKAGAVLVLDRLLEAESRVHGVTRQQLHLHEIGSMDTLIDVVGVVAGLKRLGVGRVLAAPLLVGTSQPQRSHAYPVPAMATLELAAMAGAPLDVRQDVSHEMTTPTGAALLTTLATFQAPTQFTLDCFGYGAGVADLTAMPNVMSVWLGETEEAPATDSVVLLETNLDDVPGVVLGYVQEVLFQQGALDVWCTPVQMKKNRPGVVLSALVPAHLEQLAVRTFLTETPTLGVRIRKVERQVAHRGVVSFQSEFGLVQVKLKYLEGRAVAASPEYEDCRKLALELGMPLQVLYQRVASQAREQLL